MIGTSRGALQLLRGSCLLLAVLPAIALEFRREALISHGSQEAVANREGASRGTGHPYPPPQSAMAASGGASAEDGPPSPGAHGGGGNPVLAMYRKWTLQYQKDAQEASSAAAYYAQQTKMLEEEVSPAKIGDAVRQRLSADGVPLWAYAAWTVQGMLNDPTPVKAAAAAAEAAAPYNAAYAAYDKAKGQFNTAAVGYALRAKQDGELAHQLMSYSNQFRLQGNADQADTYKGQATSLMKQAEKFKGLADKDQQMADKIYNVLPSIQGWAGKAGAAAAYDENPLGNLPAKDIFPFTVVPPADF